MREVAFATQGRSSISNPAHAGANLEIAAMSSGNQGAVQ